MQQASESPVVRFNGRIPVALQAAIAVALSSASATAVASSKQRHSKIKLAHVIGQDRYYGIQDAFLKLKDEFPDLPIHQDNHPGCSSYYAVLEYPELRMTLAKVLLHGENPPIRPFRFGTKHRPDQIPLPLFSAPVSPDDQLQVTLVYGYADGSPETPAFIEARFLDSNGMWMTESVDVLAASISQTIPVEEIQDNTATTLRESKPNRRVLDQSGA